MARLTPEIPNASMADIAFLLLTFFLVTTTITNDKGLSIALPAPLDPNQPKVEFQQKNLYAIQVNSTDALLVEGEPLDDVSGLKEEIKKFILNRGVDPKSSDNPEKAIVTYKADRGTSHKRFVQILDIIQNAYYDVWADQAGVTNKKYRDAASDLTKDDNREIYNKGKKDIPMNISIAEPTKVGG